MEPTKQPEEAWGHKKGLFAVALVGIRKHGSGGMYAKEEELQKQKDITLHQVHVTEGFY